MPTLSITSQMIYHRGGEPERAMHCCHDTQAMDNKRLYHRLLFHERGKQYFVQPFLQSAISSVNEATEAFTKLHTEVMR